MYVRYIGCDIKLVYIVIIYSTQTWAQDEQDFVHQITASSGLYFDYLGKLKINNGQLDVLVPLDISHFRPHIENIHHAILNVEAMCDQIRAINKNECQSMLTPMVTRQRDLYKEFNSISHLLDTRSRRAWVAGVGSVMKHIFGTLSEDDGIRYDEAITALQNNVKKSASLIRENILVTNSVISSFNKTVYNIKANEDNLNEAINKLSILTQDLFNNTRDIEYQSHLNVIINSLETTILTLSFQLNDIIDAILFSSQNILHPAIVAPQQLHRELIDSSKYLPSNLELPTTLDISSIHFILNISQIVSYYINEKIIFVIRVPLVSVNAFSLFHVMSLPVSHNPVNPKSFSMIIPSYKYLAMTKDKSQYCNLEDLDQCKRMNHDTYICDVSTVYASDAKLSCESELITKVVNQLPSSCKTEIINGNLNIWKSIKNNKWIFVQSQPIKLSVDCIGSPLREHIILGTGVLQIPPGCTGYCKSTTFISKSYFNNVTIPFIYSDFNLIKDNCCNLAAVEKVDNVSLVSIENVDLEDLNSYHSSLLHELKIAKELTDSPHIVKYGTHYSTITIILIIIVVIYIMYNLYKCKKPSGRFQINIPIMKPRAPSSEHNHDQQTDTPTNQQTLFTAEEIPLPKLRTNI